MGMQGRRACLAKTAIPAARRMSPETLHDTVPPRQFRYVEFLRGFADRLSFARCKNLTEILRRRGLDQADGPADLAGFGFLALAIEQSRVPVGHCEHCRKPHL